MGVFRRLSHAFTGQNLPNFSPPDQPTAGPSHSMSSTHLVGESYDPDHPDSVGFASSSRWRSQGPVGGPSNLDYEPSFAASRQSFDDGASDFDRKSIAPSYLTSVQGTNYQDDSDNESEAEDGEGGDKYALMTAHLYHRAQRQGWFKSKKVIGMGVVSIRMKRRQYKYVHASVRPVFSVCDRRLTTSRHLSSP